MAMLSGVDGDYCPITARQGTSQKPEFGMLNLRRYAGQGPRANLFRRELLPTGVRDQRRRAHVRLGTC